MPCAASNAKSWRHSSHNHHRRLIGLTIDNTNLADQFLDWQRVCCVIWKIAPADPVDWRVEMGARMFTKRNIMPVPGWPTLIISRDFLHAKRSTLAKFRRQDNDREIWIQPVRKINDLYITADEVGCEIGQQAVVSA